MWRKECATQGNVFEREKRPESTCCLQDPFTWKIMSHHTTLCFSRRNNTAGDLSLLHQTDYGNIMNEMNEKQCMLYLSKTTAVFKITGVL